jgi:REP element-mobilizing transposase RayT
MSRPLRLEYAGAWWHITSRGVERRNVFADDCDRRAFLRTVAAVVRGFRWRLHAYVLMSNHFHMLVETVEPTLSRGMHKLGGTYAAFFNQRHDRVGHLFQGRFKAHLIDSETYLLRVAKYIVLNPVRAGIVARAEEWIWSSHRAAAGLASVPRWLTITEILARFDPCDPAIARKLYRQFVDEVPSGSSPWDALVGQLYLGGEEFMDRVQRRIDERSRSEEHPRAQRIVRCATIEDVRRAVVNVTREAPAKSASPRSRTAFATLARTEALASLKEIGASLGISAEGASYLIRRSREMRREDAAFAQLIERIQLVIRNYRLQT